MNDEPRPGNVAFDCPARSHFLTSVMSFLHAPGISTVVFSAVLVPDPLFLALLQLP